MEKQKTTANFLTQRLKKKIRKHGMPYIGTDSFKQIKEEFIAIYLEDKTLESLTDINLRFLLSINKENNFISFQQYLSQIKV